MEPTKTTTSYQSHQDGCIARLKKLFLLAMLRKVERKQHVAYDIVGYAISYLICHLLHHEPQLHPCYVRRPAAPQDPAFITKRDIDSIFESNMNVHGLS